MWIVDFAVSCATAAMSEPPPKAIAMIARFYATLEERIAKMIVDAKRVAAKKAAWAPQFESTRRPARHKSLSVLMGFVRPAQAFDDVALTTMIT
jgi:hypothetical protein